MEEEKKYILELTSRSLILSKEVKGRIISEIDELSVDLISKLYFILGKIDEKQTEVLSKKLEKEPWFFMKLQGIIGRESYEMHLAEELDELQGLDHNFEKMLKSL